MKNEKMLFTDEDFKNAADRMAVLSLPLLEYLMELHPIAPGNYGDPNSGKYKLYWFAKEIEKNIEELRDGWGLVPRREFAKMDREKQKRREEKEAEQKRLEYEKSDKGRIERLERELARLKNEK